MERTAKMALVTGANRGMGLETCRILARLGYQVIVTSRDEIRGKQVVQSLAQHRLTVLYQRLDVADPESVKQMVLRRARCCQMWYAKEPHSAFSK